jgi:hypothetical protein
MLGERITRGKKGNEINPENRSVNAETQRKQSRKRRNGINTAHRERRGHRADRRKPLLDN